MADKKVALVIDDEPFIVEVITTYLQLNGYEVRGAFTGEDGLTLIPLEKPDILLLDLMLPDIHGFEVCKRVRAMPDFATLPILIVSARTEPESQKRAEKVGANGYLVKPIRMPELLAEMKKILSAPTVQPAAPPPPPVQSAVLPASSTPPAPPAAPVVTPALPPAPPVITPPAVSEKPAEPPSIISAEEPSPSTPPPLAGPPGTPPGQPKEGEISP